MPRIDLDILNQKQTPAFYASSLATRPAASFVGRIFIDSDSPSTGLYRDTGTAWVQIADPGAGSTGTLQQVTTNGNTTSIGLIVTAGTFSTVSDLVYNTGNGVDWLIKNIPNGPLVRLKAHGTQGGYSNRRGALGWKDNNGNNTDVIAWDDTTVTTYQDTIITTKLGINTATAGVYLDVHGTTGVIAQLENTTTQNTLLSFRNQGAGAWSIGNGYNAGANDFIIYDAVSFVNRFTIKGTGQTFIGSDTTSSGLLVVNSATSDNHIVCIGANAPSIRLRNTGTSPTLNAGFGISTATNNFIQGSASGNYCIFNSSTTASPILFGVYDAGAGNTQEAARISSARNWLVGGTSDNGQKLQITGSASFSSQINVNNNLSTFGAVGSTGYPITVQTNVSEQTIKILGKSNNSDIQFFDSTGSNFLAHIGIVATDFVIGTGSSGTNRLTIDSTGISTFSNAIIQGGGIYKTTNQFSLTGGSTATFYTFASVAANQVYLVTVRQAGGGANTVVGMSFIYSTSTIAYNIGQDNTNPALYLTLSMSGLNLQLTTGAGYGATTWDYTITIIK
jgi:hypothetical protein